MIVVLAYFSSAIAQGYLGANPNNYESHWTFNGYDYNSQVPFVCAITIDGQVVTINTENWSDLEVAAFVTTAEGQEECRGNMMWLTDEYVIEYDDPFLTIDGYPIYYNTPGGTVHFKMYDHANNIEYTECTVTYLGDPYTVTAGIGVVHSIIQLFLPKSLSLPPSKLTVKSLPLKTTPTTGMPWKSPSLSARNAEVQVWHLVVMTPHGTIFTMAMWKNMETRSRSLMVHLSISTMLQTNWSQ